MEERVADIRLLPDGAGEVFRAGARWRWVDLVGRTVGAERPGWRYLRGLVVGQLRRMIELAGDVVAADAERRLPATRSTREAVAAQLLSAPPVQGAEYWGGEALAGVLATVEREVAEALALHPLVPLAEWARSLSDAWRDVGKISFHLAENKADATGERPFAFMATFIGTAADGSVRHWPLGTALQMYRGNPTALQLLIEPVRRVAERGGLMERMLAENRLFRPCAWTPSEAYEFLHETEAYFGIDLAPADAVPSPTLARPAAPARKKAAAKKEPASTEKEGRAFTSLPEMLAYIRKYTRWTDAEFAAALLMKERTLRTLDTKPDSASGKSVKKVKDLYEEVQRLVQKAKAAKKARRGK